jgi:hypothetical protein
MKNLLAVIFCLASLPAGAQTENQTTSTESKGTVSGKVNNERERPVPEVKVFVYNGNDIIGSGTTDPDGRFLTNRIVTGKYTVRAVANGYKSMVVTDVPVMLNGDTEINFKIFPQTERDDTTSVYASYNVVSVKKPATSRKAVKK